MQQSRNVSYMLTANSRKCCHATLRLSLRGGGGGHQVERRACLEPLDLRIVVRRGCKQLVLSTVGALALDLDVASWGEVLEVNLHESAMFLDGMSSCGRGAVWSPL